MARTKTPRTLGGKIDALFRLREQKTELAGKIRAIEKEFDIMQEQVMMALDSADTRLAEGRSATASITEETQPSVQDWDTLHPWISKNKAQYLYYRRLNAAAFRELLESRRGRKIPGVDAISVRKLHLRKIS